MTIPAGRITRLFGTDGGVMLSLYPRFPPRISTPTRRSSSRSTGWTCRSIATGSNGAASRRRRGLRRLRHRTARTGACSGSNSASTRRTGRRTSSTSRTSSDSRSRPRRRDRRRGAPESSRTTTTATSTPLFELEIAGRRVLVPAAEEFIAHIDFEGRTVHLVLPGGLLDLQ